MVTKTAMKMSIDELNRRLAEADRMRAILRRATLEWREVGEQVFSKRRNGSESQAGPERSDDRGPPGR
jgi:hypothetical protein